MNTNRAIEILKDVIHDFESGYIANPSRKADRLRDRHEANLNAILLALKNRDIGDKAILVEEAKQA